MRITFRQSRLCCLVLFAVGILVFNGISPVQADTPAVRVKDINPTSISPGFTYGPEPKLLASAGSRVFFVGAEYRNGYELWISDLTLAGTRIVRDIVPGPEGPFFGAMAALNGKLFFSANAYGTYELWSSDGTAAGTMPVKPQSAGGPNNPASLTSVGSTLYFGAQNAQGQMGLWKSDGTTAGTVEVKQVELTDLAAVSNRVFFAGNDGTHGSELWVSDGTAAGTRMVKDINPAGGSFQQSSNSQMTVVGDKLFFVTTASGVQGQLWQSDGTAAGTTRVMPTNPDADLTAGELENVNGTLYFHGTSRIDTMGTRSTGLWKSNGTAAGTIELKSFYTGTGFYLLPRQLIGAGNRLFFGGADFKLWTSDGTIAGTRQVKDVLLGENPPVGPTAGLAVNGKLLFISNNGAGGGGELWTSDGTEAGTRRLKVINPTGSSLVSSLVQIGNGILFAANTNQLWKSDGTEAGTVQLKDFIIAPAGFEPFHTYGELDYQLIDIGGKLFFTANDGTHDEELWLSDGTAAGTRLVKEINPTGSARITSLTSWNGKLFFISNAVSSALWTSDGTTAGTTAIKSFTSGPDIFAAGLIQANGALFFISGDSAGYTLWKSNGTPAGTTPVATLPAIEPPPTRLVAVNGRLFFLASDADHGRELWTSDGTAAGTKMVKDLDPGDFSSELSRLTAMNGKLYFIAENPASSYYELWRSDGSADGTVRVKEFGYNDLEGAPAPNNFTAIGNRLYFTAYDLDAGEELWVSDGTEGGTRRVKDINIAPNSVAPYDTKNASSHPTSLADVNGTLLFSVDDGVHGRELWRSDGTVSGTILVRDINPGPLSSAVASIKQVDSSGWALFAASDGLGGVELWRTQGTLQSTLLVQDIALGASSSLPEAFTVSSARVFFAADDGLVGAELWAVERATVVAPPQQKVYLPLIRR
jgi:ELWxxDGT repeat protein